MLAVCAGATWRHRHENADGILIAEIWGAAIVAGGALASGYMSSQAAKSGANAQQNANNAAIGEQQREFNQTQQNLSPYIQSGNYGLGLQQQYLSGDTSGFANSPDYQFALSQGEKASQAGAAAKGNLWGGGQTADAITLGQGLATQYANNYWNKISGVAGQGLSAANSLASSGQQNANAQGGYLQNSGQAQASGDVGSANAWGNTLGQIGNIAGQYYQNSGGTPGTSSYSLGNNQGNYWSNPSYGNINSGTYNIAAMSGGK